MAETLPSYYLICQTGTSNKWYKVWIERQSRGTSPDRFEVWVGWGRIGQNGREQHKCTVTSQLRAQAMAADIVSKKRQRGYELLEEDKEPQELKIKTKKTSLGRFSSLAE